MEDVQQQQIKSEETTVACSTAFTEDQEVDLRQELKHDYNSPHEFLRWDDEDTQEMIFNSNDDRDFSNMYSEQCGHSSKGAAGNTIESENFSGAFSPGYGRENINDSDGLGIEERNQISCLQDKHNVCSSEDHGGMRSNEDDKQNSHNVRAEVMIQQDKVGLIIGRGGRTIKALQEKTRTKMHIVQINSSFHNASPVNSNSLSKTLVIIGTQDAILHAEQLVYDLISKATTSLSPSERSVNSSPSHSNSPSGSNNNKHENYSNNSGGPTYSLGSGRMGSKYSSSNNNNVHSRSGNFNNNNNSNNGNKSQKIKTIRFPVPKISVGLIIGKGGETIKKIRMETGAKVQFNPLNTCVGEKNEQIAIITGTHEQIRYACDLIEELIDTALNCGEKYNNSRSSAADDSSTSWGDEISPENAPSSSQIDCTKQYQYVQDSQHPSSIGSFPIQHDNANTCCNSNSTNHSSNSRNDIMIEESSGNIGDDRVRLVSRKEKKTIRNMNQCSGSSGGYCDGQLAESSNMAGLDYTSNGSTFDTAKGYGGHQVKHGKEQHFSKNSRNATTSDKRNQNRDHFCPNPNYQMSTEAHSQLFSLGNGQTNIHNNVQPGTVEWGQGDQNTQWGTYNEPPYSEPTQMGHQECYMHLPTQIGVGSDYSQWVQYPHPRQSSDQGQGYNAAADHGQDLKPSTIPPVPIMSATIVQNPGDPVNLMAPPAIYFSLPPIHSPNNSSPNLPPDHQSGNKFDQNGNNCENLQGAGILQERVENENNGLHKVETSSYSISAAVENTNTYDDSTNFDNKIDTQKLPEKNLFQPTNSTGLDSSHDSFNLDNSAASEAKDPRELRQEQFINQKFDNNSAAPGFASQPFTVIYPQNSSGSGPDNSGQTSNIGAPGSCTRIVSFYYDLNVNSIVIMNQWHYY